ncbi:hypothetical protein [uncultured Hymenobacter sp.]|uniref:hypothetical protein n=1 Tax=uncultured Hymenobacter sp. TaxID=170016 RepID=UPI0035CA331B
MEYLFLGWRVLLGLSGIGLVIVTLSAAIRSFILPRNETVRVNAFVFIGVRALFDLAASAARTYARRDSIMAHYAPVALVALPIVWEAMLSLAYTLIFWALGEGSWYKCYQLSCSSLLTLGSSKSHNVAVTVFSYSEATLGLLLLTLLLSYLPTIYQAFSRRETTVARLELRAGAPAKASTLLLWLHRGEGGLQDDTQQWGDWEQWFVELEESHTSLPIISFFRSPQPGRSWVTACGLILDTANLFFAALDVPRLPQAELTFKAGCISLNRIYRYFDTKAKVEPTNLLPGSEADEKPGQADFEAACDELAARDLPVRADRAAAWQQFQELRSRYQPAREFLAELTMAPESKLT